MRTSHGALIAVIGLVACHHPGTKPDSGAQNPNTDSALDTDTPLCITLNTATPTSCPYPYLAVDPNTAAAICSSPNEVAGTLTSACASAPTGSLTKSGTWVPGRVSAQHLSVQMRCPGAPDPSGINAWACATEAATMLFADGSSVAFADSSPGVALESCSPASFFVELSSADGWTAQLRLQAQALAAGSFQLYDGSTLSPNAQAVAIGFALVPPGDEPYAAGVFSDGTVTFSEASLDPNHDLAFSLDANIATPTGNVQEEFAIYCSDSGGPHSGHWLNFQSD